jgi:deoxyribose-phosphate aldolase
MTEAELAALADEIVARIRNGRTKGGRSGGQAVRRSVGPSVRPSAGPSPSAVLPLPVSKAATAPALDRTAQDIAWRGPNVMRAAWTEAQGARRVADFVDHTLLKPEATAAEVDKLCAEAREHRFAAVCVNPVWVDTCARLLKGSEVAVCTVIGFPLGANTAKVKGLEAADAVARGAHEVDMVAAIGRIKGGEWAAVEDDMRAVVESSGRALVKVIIESAALTQEEIIKTCALAKEAGADFVKTSTGFHAAGGATAKAVRLMRLVVGDDLGVKASGGVRDCKTALAMIAAGASRIGTSSGVGFATCLGPGPLPLAELLKRPHDHVASCTSGTCGTAGGTQY